MATVTSERSDSKPSIHVLGTGISEICTLIKGHVYIAFRRLL